MKLRSQRNKYVEDTRASNDAETKATAAEA